MSLGYRRTQIYLEPADHERLKAEARRKGITLAELIRQIVRVHFQTGPDGKRLTKEDYMSIVGMFDSGLTDVAERHTYYAGEAAEAHHLEHSR